MKNKSILLIALAVLLALLSSCDKDGGASKAKVKFRKANIGDASMLALAQNQISTKAEGDVAVGPKALYTVSEDGTMVQVTYNIDVEGANGEVAETIQANLIISPNFIFPVGEGWIWLANCHLDVKDGWSNNTIPKGPARSAISKLINGFSEKYHERHGAHYLIRKSDGALFEWTLEAGAPNGMDDGFKQPTFLNGWFHQLGNDLFVTNWGWSHSGMSDPNLPSLIRLQDNGSTLDAVNTLGNNIGCGNIFPAGDCLGAELYYPNANGYSLGIIAPPSFSPVLLENSTPGKGEMFFLSIGGKLYLGVGQETQIVEGDGKEQWTRDGYRTDIYNLIITGTSLTKGGLICSVNEAVSGGEECFISTTDKLSWWSGNDYDGVKIHTLDPKAGTVTTRSLPEHYPSLRNDYVNGVAYAIDGTNGYWECDLSKDAAEYVSLDWSSASSYKSKIVPGTLRLEYFEAASLTLRYSASMTDGTILSFYTPVTGNDRGKIKTTIGSENNAGMVVTTMVRLN